MAPCKLRGYERRHLGFWIYTRHGSNYLSGSASYFNNIKRTMNVLLDVPWQKHHVHGIRRLDLPDGANIRFGDGC